MKESVKIDAALVEKVRKRIKKTKQTIGGFFELSVQTSLTASPEHVQMWKTKAEKWDKLETQIEKYYGEDAPPEALCEIGETAAIAFGFL